MTTTTTPAEQLYALPEPIQEQLIRIARLASGMSAEEKTQARALLGATLLRIGVDGYGYDQVPGAELLGALGRIITTVDRLARTTRKD